MFPWNASPVSLPGATVNNVAIVFSDDSSDRLWQIMSDELGNRIAGKVTSRRRRILAKQLAEGGVNAHEGRLRFESTIADFVSATLH
jgi:hypothetical protein